MSGLLDGLVPVIFNVSGQRIRAFVPEGEELTLGNAVSPTKPSSMLLPGDPPEMVAALKAADAKLKAALDAFWAELDADNGAAV